MKKTYKFEIFTVTVLIFINLLLAGLPLTNVIGYEFSAFNGVLLFIVSGISLIHFFNKAGFAPSFMEILSENYFYFLTLLLIPFIISIASTVFFVGCPFFTGIIYYPIIVFPAVICGFAFAALSYRLHHRLSYLIFALFFVVLLIIPALEFYFYHQVYFYSPLIGFLPGTIYDTNFEITGRLIFHQGGVIIFSLGIIATLFYEPEDGSYFNKYIFLVILLVTVAAIEFLKPALGLATDRSRLEKYLSGKIETSHFTILHPPGLSKSEIKLLEFEHEFYYAKIEKQLGYVPEEKILSVIFEDRKQKGYLFGSENADVAKTWMNTIYLQADDFRNSLKHELVHIFSAEIGVTPFKIAAGFNFSMIEGYAMAIENEYAGNEVHYFAALAFKNGFKLEPEFLFRPFNFFTRTSGLSYVTAGSFIKFLLDNYDRKVINKIYSDLEFEKHTGKKLSVLSAEYAEFIEDYKVDSNPHLSRLYFGRKPLVQQFCPRYVQSRLSDAAYLFSQKRYNEAKNIYQEVFEKTNRYNALQGILNSLIRLDQIDRADSLCSVYLSEYDSTAFQYSFEWKRAEILALKGELPKADSYFRKFISQKPGTRFTNLAKIRHLLYTTDSIKFQNYITGSSFDRYKMLKQLNREDLKYFSIPAMINLTEHFDEDYEVFIGPIKSNMSVTDEESSRAAFELSKYALKKNYISDAEFFALKSLEFVEHPGRLSVLEEHLEKIKWIKERIN